MSYTWIRNYVCKINNCSGKSFSSEKEIFCVPSIAQISKSGIPNKKKFIKKKNVLQKQLKILKTENSLWCHKIRRMEASKSLVSKTSIIIWNCLELVRTKIHIKIAFINRKYKMPVALRTSFDISRIPETYLGLWTNTLNRMKNCNLCAFS